MKYVRHAQLVLLLVVLTSFNEFFEGTHIEPSERYGDTYLRLTKEQSDQYRGSFP